MVRGALLSSGSIVRASMAASILVVSACVGDAPIVSGSGPDASLASSDVENDGGSADASSARDADAVPVTCQDFETACSGSCVDPTSSKTNCGSCGHDCGGGACVDSVCQPFVVRDALDHPVFDIDDGNVYFSSGNKLLSCPLGGCAGASPRQIGSVAYDIQKAPNGALRVGGGNVIFVSSSPDQGQDYLYQCATSTGCTTPPAHIGSSGNQAFGDAFVVHGSDVYWTINRLLDHASCAPSGACTSPEGLYPSVSPITGVVAADDAGVYFTEKSDSGIILRCPTSGSGCAPTPIGTAAKSVTQLAAQGQKVWILSSGGDGYVDGSIRTCPMNDPTCSGTLFADRLPFPTEFAVDANAVTWINRDGYGGKPEIVTCPIGGCAGGPRTLAKVEADANGLRSDERYVYWATGARILRVAK